jgi:hypothetical protein
VAGFPAVADFDALGEAAREIRLPRYGGASAEPEPPMVTEGEYVIVRGGRCNGFGPPRSFHTDDRVGRPGQGARLVQWTDQSGGAYDEDPYGGTGGAYACSHQSDGGTVTDTATLSWDTAHLVPWTPPAGDLIAMVAKAQIPGTPPLGSEPDHIMATEWDWQHGEVITPMPPTLDPSGRPAPQDTPENHPARPVFVDASGRRQRRVRRAARLLVIPAGGYVALMISALLGGPTISAPFVPLPDAPHPATPSATAPDSPSGADPAAQDATSGAAHGKSRAAAGQPAVSSTTSEPAVTATATTSPTTGAAPAPTATPTATHSTKGREIASSHKPTK